MRTKFKINWLLVIILLFAAGLRFWHLGDIPPSLTSDEAALGYNAYSILKTGKDEYGKPLPIIFKSFGDYKPGLYVYLDVPFVAPLGLNEFSTRLPSAFAGVISVYLIYLIASKLFDKKTGTISAFVMAATPWSIYFSRGAWEVNVSLTLTLLGIYLFLKSLQNSRFLIPASISFALTLLTYQGAKLSTGIVILILAGIYWRDIIRFDKKDLFGGIGIGFLISLPIILSLFTGQAGRLDVFSVFSYPRPKDYTQAFLDEGKEKFGSLSYYLFHSESLNFARGIMGRLFNHFSARFLFFEGDWSNPRHSAPYQGMLLIGDIITLLVGLFVLFRDKFIKEKLFILLWLALSPLPSILSRDQVHAVRALNMQVPLIVIIAFGLSYILTFKTRFKYVFFVFYALSFVYFLDAYFVHVPAHDSQLWNYGYREIVEAVTPLEKNYKAVKVQQSFAQPYIYFLFYQKYDPANYQKQAKLVGSGNVGDVGYITKLDNIEFGPIDWSIDRGDHGVLIIGDPIRIPPEDSKDSSQFKLIEEIKYLNGRDVAFRIIEIK